MTSSAHGKYKCPTCGREFVARIKSEPICRKCKVQASTVCRRCNHARKLASRRLQYCQSCIDFVKFQKSGEISATPTGRLADRPSRARRLSNRSDSLTGLNVQAVPALPPLPKKSRTSRFAKGMRRRPTQAEKRLLNILTKVLPAKGEVQNQWQFACLKKNYILDFYIRQVRLGIEVDGQHHKFPDIARADELKEQCLRERGIHLVRITNEQVMESSEEDLVEWLREVWRQASRMKRQSGRG